jgi:hypothetical protein
VQDERQNIVELKRLVGNLKRDIAIVERKTIIVLAHGSATVPAWRSAAGCHARTIIGHESSVDALQFPRDALQADVAALAAALDILSRDIDRRFPQIAERPVCARHRSREVRGG